MPAIAHQNKILGNTSGGGSTIKVTTSESILYGQTVTLTDGTTTMSGTFSGTGECEFTGVMMTGTVTASSGGASTSINVPYFGVYTMSLAFFSATITVTYSGGTCTCVGNGESYTASGSPYTFTVHGAATYTITNTIDGISKTDTVTITTDGQSESVSIEFGTINVTYDNDFRGATVTCSQGGTSISKVAPSGGNTMSFYPPTTGNWTISGNVGGTVYGTTANVTSLSTPVPVNLETIPDGSTATPTDVVQTWLACAGIKDKAYTTLSQVIGDSETFNALLGDSNACAYMARSTTFASTLCADQYSMNLIGQYDVCCDALLADSTWASAIANSTYFESVLNVKVPVMTSNTTPEGEAFCNTVASGYAAYEAFNKLSGAYNMYTSTSLFEGYVPETEWIGYKFTSPVKICRVDYKNSQYASNVKFYFEGKNDADADWTRISGELTAATSDAWTTFVFPNSSAFNSNRCLYTAGQAGTQGGANIPNVREIQFYGRIPSSEKIHGGNGDTFYHIVDGNHVPVTDPATLDVGTYTIYSNGLAKDPNNLSNDYGKQVRICPNTKEIVVRPDNALYWWGYESSNLEDMTSANGWSRTNVTLSAPTHDNQYISIGSSSGWQGVGSKTTMSASKIHTVAQGVSGSGFNYVLAYTNNKALSSATDTNETTYLDTTLKHQVYTLASTKTAYIYEYAGTSRYAKILALWTK